MTKNYLEASTINSNINLRLPTAEDGFKVHTLIQKCPPLDTNSAYCNLLQCHHFANTCIVAESNAELLGFVSGYLLPEKPEVLFLWQVAIDKEARGKGLALSMIRNLLMRSHCSQVRLIQATVNPSNESSWSLFKKLASALNTCFSHQTLFDKHIHFEGKHDSEILLSVGPFSPQSTTQSNH